MAEFSYTQVPLQNKCRWFVKHGATTRYDRGFRSKAEADAWINAFGRHLDWRAGYVFRLKGGQYDISVIDRQGVLAKP
ncbi:hypothetical protein V0M98_33175 (plasmid) [Pseudomonas silesiensis]|uniref:hypothetical protein n=1 Tax=Pseudomonas silesiensis TaxID=1853130 RepID=UPI0030CBBA03